MSPSDHSFCWPNASVLSNDMALRINTNVMGSVRSNHHSTGYMQNEVEAGNIFSFAASTHAYPISNESLVALLRKALELANDDEFLE